MIGRFGRTCKLGVGSQPGMAKRALAGLTEAGSVVVATISVTIVHVDFWYPAVKAHTAPRLFYTAKLK